MFKHGSKVQGDWGETILEELLSSQGLTKGVHFETQAVIRDSSGKPVKNADGGIMRPDVILHLDERREVIIDSKVSLTAYVDYVNAENEADRQSCLKAHLESNQMARTFEVPDDEDKQAWFASYNLLTAKPTIYAANVDENDLADDGASNPHVASVREMAKEENAEVFVICAQIEQELAELSDEEKEEFLLPYLFDILLDGIDYIEDVVPLD